MNPSYTTVVTLLSEKPAYGLPQDYVVISDAAFFDAHRREALPGCLGLPYWAYPPMGYNTNS